MWVRPRRSVGGAGVSLRSYVAGEPATALCRRRERVGFPPQLRIQLVGLAHTQVCSPVSATHLHSEAHAPSLACLAQAAAAASSGACCKLSRHQIVHLDASRRRTSPAASQLLWLWLWLWSLSRCAQGGVSTQINSRFLTGARPPQALTLHPVTAACSPHLLKHQPLKTHPPNRPIQCNATVGTARASRAGEPAQRVSDAIHPPQDRPPAAPPPPPDVACCGRAENTFKHPSWATAIVGTACAVGLRSRCALSHCKQGRGL